MDAAVQLVFALGAAALLVGLFGILRRAMRSPGCPEWLNNVGCAYIFAMSLTLGFAASLFYVGFAATPIIGAKWGILATFAAHIGLVALMRVVLPLSEDGHEPSMGGAALQQA